MTGVITTIPKHKRIKLSPKKYNKLKEEVFERDQCCVLCGKSATDLHHVIFRSQMGDDSMENCVALCHDCHKNKPHGDDSREIRVVLLQYLEAIYDD